MSDSQPHEQGISLQDQALGEMLQGMRDGKHDIKVNGEPVEVIRPLGAGGTKKVFDVALGGNRVALALPNDVDGVIRMKQKWENIMHEPENTNRVRALGIPTNTVCETVPITLNGVPFDALRLTRYEDLPFQVLDGKNRLSTEYAGSVLPEQLDSESFQALFGGIVTDTATLISNGVHLGRDSFNVCVVDNGLRLFLNDLGSARFEPFEPGEIDHVSQQYTISTLDAFVNGLNEEEYQRHKGFLDGKAFEFNNPDKMSVILARAVRQKVTE